MFARFIVLITICAIAAAKPAVVDLGYAKYRGSALSNGVSQWLGIRYAAPPLGRLRFSAPQDPEEMAGIQEASQHGPLCIATNEYPILRKSSEDCLFLDVYAPSRFRGASSKLLPVYVFIQGGGFNSLGNANYNASGLIQASDMGIVVVTFSYRVGPYGFLASEEVLKGGSVNNGLKDQIHVLKWVRKHISKFGGDPKHVVVGGDSAGAASVTLLLSAYGGRNDGLFHATIAESQSFATMFTIEESQFAYNNLVIRTGCASDLDTLSCLRNLDTDTFQSSNIATALPRAQQAPLYFYAPTIDYDLVPDYTYRLFHEGRFIKVPVVFGDVTNEGTQFVPANISSVGQANTFLQAQFPALQLHHLRRINEWYLRDDQTVTFPNAGIYWRPTSNVYGDIRYTCPGMDMSSVYARAGVPSWNYHYDVRDPTNETAGFGVYHVVELNAIWGPQYVSKPPPTSYYITNAPIIPVIRGYWISFIKTFDPNPYRDPGSPAWRTWDSGRGFSRIYLRTGATKMETAPFEQRERCKYFIGIGTDLAQ